MTISVAVMAHPRREALALKLALALGDGTRIVWDRYEDEWDTGRRAWETYSPTATHHVVVQDDAIACRDLVAGLDAALEYVPARAAVSLYVGTTRPDARRVQTAVSEAERTGAAWIAMRDVKWGVGLVVPTAVIPDMLAFADSLGGEYDSRLSQFFRRAGWPVWCTWPSLVDHRDEEPGLVRHMIPPSGKRRAHRFLAGSALDVDWSAGVVHMPGAPQAA